MGMGARVGREFEGGAQVGNDLRGTTRKGTEAHWKALSRAEATKALRNWAMRQMLGGGGRGQRDFREME